MEILGDENVENFAEIGNCRSVQVRLVVFELVPLAGKGSRDPVDYSHAAVQEGQVIVLI